MNTPRHLQILLRSLIRPAVAFCVRHSLKLQDIIDCVKLEFLSHATDEIKRQGAKVTDSKLSVMTGLQRRDVVKILKGTNASKESPNIIFRVINRWRDDPAFLTSANVPRILSFDPEKGEFQNLVKQISQDMSPATILFELERLHYVERSPRGIKLLVDNFIPRGELRLDEGAKILALDAEDLGHTACHNILHPEEPPLHHLRTEYDRIRPEALPHLRNWFLKEGHDFHLRARAEIAKYDQEVNPDPKFSGSTARVSFSSSNYIDTPPPPDKEETD